MKKHFLLLTFLFLGIKSFTQNNTCTSALPISDLTTCSLEEVKDTVSWFSFVATSANQEVLVSYHLNGPAITAGENITYLQGITLFSGTCTSLLIIADRSISGGQTLIISRHDLVAGNTYYVRVRHQFIGGVSFNLCFNQRINCCTLSVPTCELICNGNFEDSLGCVFQGSNMYQAKCWDKRDLNNDTTTLEDLNSLPNFGTPDYFNSNFGTCPFSCNTFTVDVPQNTYNTAQVPSYAGANAYAGIISYIRDDVPPNSPFCNQPSNYREYLQQKLNKPMQAGRKYRIRFAYRLSDSSDYATKFGILFSNDTIDQNNATVYLHRTPQLTTNHFLTTNNHWDTINFVYTVPSNVSYSWMALGNFKPDNGDLQFLNNGKLYHTTPGSTPCYPCTSVWDWAYYFIDSVSIKPIDTLKVIPRFICHKNNFDDTIVASLPNDSGVVFSWVSNPVDTSLIGQNANDTIIVHPIVTTDYIVGVTDIYGCTYTDTATIYMPPLDSVVGGNSICINDTLLYTVNNCASIPHVIYSWSAINGNVVAQSLNGCQITIDWTPAQSALGGIIICLATDTITGCTNADTIIVSKCCTQPNPSCLNGNPNLFNTSVTAENIACSSFEPYFPSAHTYRIIGKSFSINGTFTVDSNLTINGCQIVLGPEAKIIVLPGRTLQITRQGQPSTSHLYGCNPMWDAIYVMDSTAKIIIDQNTLIEDADTAIALIHGARFDILSTIFNKNYKDIVIEPYAGAYPSLLSRVRTSAFTCRIIPPNTSENVVSADIITNALTTTNIFALTTLQSPHVGVVTRTGIELNNVTNHFPLNIGLLGAPQANVFDDMDNAIRTIGSNALIRNNYFIKISQHGFMVALPAVWCSGDTSIAFNGDPRMVKIGQGINFGDNRFFNCPHAVLGDQELTLWVRNNSFTQIGTGVAYTGANNMFNQLLCNFNTFNSFNTGISCNLNPISLNEISHNIMDAQTRNGATGIIVQEFSNTNPLSVWSIGVNTISNVYRGIVANNLRQAGIGADTIHLRQTASAQTRGITITNNLGTAVHNNTIDYVNSGNNYSTAVGGIYASVSPGSLFRCNFTYHLGYGLECNGSMVSDIFDNTFTDHRYGFWLNNHGFVGRQDGLLAPLNPSYNQWIVPFLTSRCFASNSTFGNLSPIYWRATVAIFKPTPSLAQIGSTPVADSVTTNGSTTPPPCFSTGGGGGGNNLMIHSHQLAQNQIAFAGDDSVVTKWMSRQGLFNKILTDTIDVSSDALLTQFMNNNMSAPIGVIYSVNNTLSDPTTSHNSTALNNALLANAGMHTTNVVELNHKRVNEIFLNYHLHGSFTQQEINHLRYIANLCPFSHGTAVYQARALLSLVDTVGTEYINPCEIDADQNNLRYAANGDSTDVSNELNVYPNPTTGEVSISFGTEMSGVEFSLFDVTGKKVMNRKLTSENKITKIDLGNLQNGIYIYKIINKGELMKAGKLIISK